MLYILIVEVDDGVAVRERLALDPVIENDLFLAVLVYALDLSVVANELLDNFLVGNGLPMVLLGELETEVFLFILLMLLSILLFHLVVIGFNTCHVELLGGF